MLHKFILLGEYACCSVNYILYVTRHVVIRHMTKFSPPPLLETSPALLQSPPPKTFAFPYFEGSFQPFIRSSYFPGRSLSRSLLQAGQPAPVRAVTPCPEVVFLRPPLGVTLWFRGCEAYNIHESVAPI